MPGRWATATDFFGGAAYTEYRHHDGFRERADWILQKWPGVVGQKVLVVGCGPGGFLVEDLIDRGVSCYGIDAYAKNVAHGFVTIETRADVAARCIMDADTTNSSDVARIKGRTFADLRGQSKFYLIVTDDVLSALSSPDVSVAIPIITSNADRALHILTVNRSASGPDPERDTSLGYNWLTEAAWRVLINSAGGVSNVCWNTETKLEF